jgi:hypothetical protein
MSGNIWFWSLIKIGRTQGGVTSLQPPKRPKTEILTNTDFVDTMISKVLRDLPCNRNQPLKSADDSTSEF